eukprot:1346623-Prymnesium_polylepis.1
MPHVSCVSCRTYGQLRETQPYVSSSRRAGRVQHPIPPAACANHAACAAGTKPRVHVPTTPHALQGRSQLHESPLLELSRGFTALGAFQCLDLLAQQPLTH